MWECEQAYYRVNQRGLLQDLIQRESDDNQRILYQDEHAIAFVPICARYPYEVWIAPKASCHIYRSHLRAALGLARALKPLPSSTTVCGTAPPYLAWFQAPTDAQTRITPACRVLSTYRTRDRLKYLAELNWQQVCLRTTPP